MSGGPHQSAATPAATPAAISQAELSALLERLDRLESQVAELRAAAGPEVPRDVMLVLAAAVAAYLGKQATIKQVRLVSDTTWASTGRAYVHGSHRRQG